MNESYETNIYYFLKISKRYKNILTLLLSINFYSIEINDSLIIIIANNLWDNYI